jgi:hypothetical protein
MRGADNDLWNFLLSATGVRVVTYCKDIRVRVAALIAAALGEMSEELRGRLYQTYGERFCLNEEGAMEG